jgi:hypothetical protein
MGDAQGPEGFRQRRGEVNTEIDIRPVLRALLESQRFAVLATDDHGQPFASLMAFAATEDLRHMVILTERTTRKYANLRSNPRVALLIDDRENKGSDTELKFPIFPHATRSITAAIKGFRAALPLPWQSIPKPWAPRSLARARRRSPKAYSVRLAVA